MSADADEYLQRIESTSFRARVWRALDSTVIDGRGELILNLFLSLLVLLNVAAVILESVEWIEVAWRDQFNLFELTSVAIFSIEYLLRLWSAPESPRFQGRWGRVRYSLTTPALVDLLSILPSLLAATTLDLRVVRIFRLFRLVRILKLRRFQRSIDLLHGVVVGKREELALALILMLLLVLTSSTLMYFAEHSAQPDKFSSIPETFWWAISTLTTVGYGDVFPVTTTGRILNCIISTLGIGLFALPTAILASGFAQSISLKAPEPKHVQCPHCGKSIADV